MLAEGMFLVDRYEILSKIGAGGMSDVYKAKDHILGRMVAIKVLKQEFSEDINFVTKFRTEAQSAAGLEHPNIVNIYDVGSENGMHFIVMEYVEGITLKTYVEKKGQLSFKEATSIAIQVARGIETAHNKAITHRDIKPQNIMISTDGKVKVTDFGIAKAISSNTISSDAMGSVHYASPEQTRNGFIDGRSDIYSLGIVMYEMVTGRVPFDGESTVAVAIQHLQEEMVVPSAYAADLPISYEKIILKCTQKNPERRYQTVADLLADLRQALVTPDEDFVVIAPLVMGDTRIVNGEELDVIKSTADDADLESENGFAASEEETTEEEESEDATGFLAPKMEKVVMFGSIALGILIVAIIVFLASSMIIDWMNFGNKNSESEGSQQTESQIDDDKDQDKDKEEVEMIDIVGMSKDEAEKALAKIGLELDFVYQESDKEDGTVLEQGEKKGTMVEKGSIITVIIAGENPNVTLIAVPDVVGEDEATAEQTLKDKGFKVTKDYEYSDTVEAGKVISQTPEADAKKTKDTRVTIVISEGQNTVLVPADLVGKDYESYAKEKLENTGLEVKIENVKSNEFPTPGRVIKVEKSGANVPKGTIIVVTVSDGPEKAKTYMYEGTFTKEGAVSYEYQLLDSEGNVLLSDQGTGSTVNISKTGLEVSSGKVMITWVIEGDYTVDTDEDGVNDSEPSTTKSEYTEKVSFTAE